MIPIQINDLANPTYFSPSQIKHFLPFHQSTFSQNMFSIMKNYYKHKQHSNKIIVPDTHLGIIGEGSSNCYYSEIKSIQSDDIDGQPQHLKNTLQDGSKILNYFQSLSTKEQEKTSSQNITIRSQLWKSKGPNVEEQKNPKSHLEQPLIISYNFIKRNKRQYTYIGWITQKERSFPVLLAILRLWNIERLGLISKLNQTPIESIHKFIEHLYSSGRSFTRQVSDDYNLHQDFLKNMTLKLLSSQTSCENYQYFLKQEKRQQPQFINNLITKCLKYKIIYKKKPTQEEIWQIVAPAVSLWLQETPVNVSCSYSSHLVNDQDTNTLNFILLCCYDIPKEQKVLSNVEQHAAKTQQFLSTQQTTYKEIQSRNTADDVFRKSMIILSKFQNQIAISQSQVRKEQPSRIQNSRNRSLNTSNISEVSTQRGTKTVSMQRIMKLQNNFYELLKKLQKNQPILPPDDMKRKVKEHIKYLFKKYEKDPAFVSHSQSQHKFMVSIAKLIQFMRVQDLQTLLKDNSTQAESILEIFMQHSNYEKMKELAKRLAHDYLQSLYHKSIDHGLQNRKHTLLIYFLKKMVLTYCANFKFKNLQIDEITIPQLIQLSQGKNYKSKIYSSVLKIILPQLFRTEESSQTPIKVIAPIISYYNQYLLKRDHHHQLVYTFIGEILFQVCYFTDDIRLNFLNNFAYSQESLAKLSLKEKKLLQLLRQAGFKGFGYQVKTQFLSIVQEHAHHQQKPLIFNIIELRKPLYVQRFFKVLLNCHYGEYLIPVLNFYKKSTILSQIKSNKGYLAFILKEQIKQFSFQIIEQEPVDNQDIEDRIQSSESRIFEEIAKVNPKAKIAGVEISRVFEMSQPTSRTYEDWIRSRKLQKKQYKPIQRNKGIDCIGQVQQFYQLIKVAQSLKQKYLRYHILDENEKSYFRDCVSGLLQNKEEILSYMSTSFMVKNLKT